MTVAARRRARRFGLRAETLAALWLMGKGYRILARGFTVKGGEIDIVALRGDSVVFVEVKARKNIADAETSIHATKRRRIGRAARVWLTRNPWAVTATLRGDAVYLSRWRLPRHVPSAYTLKFD